MNSRQSQELRLKTLPSTVMFGPSLHRPSQRCPFKTNLSAKPVQVDVLPDQGDVFLVAP